MEQVLAYVLLFGIIVLIGQIFSKSLVPTSLILVITGMILSFVPQFPVIQLDSNLVLNIFLPLLIYQISSFTSWRDFKQQRRPIALLSVGHVVFITCLVAVIIHTLLPELGWPLAFVLGAVISPPDDVAIVSMAEKIRVPRRVLTILEGEGMLNDAAALILFRFALVALATQQFILSAAVEDFFIIIVGNTLYGLALGYIIGEIRLKISNTMLHLIASILTPFIAYFPTDIVLGSGIISTVVVGFILGNQYAAHYNPEFRLVSFAVWPAIAFAIQSLLFLLVGLDLHSILQNISSIPFQSLLLYSLAIIVAIILGRFLWVYVFVYFLPRFLFPFLRKKDPYPPWQFPFLTSWAGMRGSITLAAALAVPSLPVMASGANPRDLIIFLAFMVIVATFLLQGLTLPWLMNVLRLHKYGQLEQYEEKLSELSARLYMIKAVMRWLLQYRKEIKEDPKLLDEVRIYVSEYRMLKNKMEVKIKDHHNHTAETIEAKEEHIFLSAEIIEVERTALMRLWRAQKISMDVRNKLLARLDHGIKHLPE